MVQLPRGSSQLHRVEAWVGRRELHGTVEFVQEEPGGVWVHFHQVEEDTVERRKGVRRRAWGRGSAAGPPTSQWTGLFEKKLIMRSSHSKQQNQHTPVQKTGLSGWSNIQR